MPELYLFPRNGSPCRGSRDAAFECSISPIRGLEYIQLVEIMYLCVAFLDTEMVDEEEEGDAIGVRAVVHAEDRKYSPVGCDGEYRGALCVTVGE